MSFALRERCRSKRKRAITTGLVVMAGAIGGSIYAFGSPRGGAGYGPAFIVLALIGAIVAVIGARTLHVDHITRERMYFKKVPLDFLDPR